MDSQRKSDSGRSEPEKGCCYTSREAPGGLLKVDISGCQQKRPARRPPTGGRDLDRWQCCAFGQTTAVIHPGAATFERWPMVSRSAQLECKRPVSFR